MYYLQNLILDFGIRDKIDPLFVVYDVIHYLVPVILNIFIHKIIGEGDLGVFYQNNGILVC